MGYVLHTINPRLFPEQLVYIINHAEDRLLFIDRATLPLVEAIAPQLKTIEAYVVMSSRERMPETKLANVHCYEELLGRERRRLRLAGVRRKIGLHHLLHLGHDRQSQGRDLFAPRRDPADHGCCNADFLPGHGGVAK